ncbi:PIN domain-containing protein [Spirulina sp. CCNP1310]|uniref:type II toxin-antitoxin system VapC family toxin n=1 Tax=Spirulina sp. CCNP1310 TaxID=3110249 RepID=UPI002B204CC9|nr:PIN domain-containing protein [Spirulina sp. CCNP1310]MEA5420801.1 PIN domain-containing protein [Spirulina sp. CCNP1310]
MTLCDASVLIALINADDENHNRCVNALSVLPAPLITTWSCFTEAMHLLGRYSGWSAQQELWNYVANKILVLYLPDDAEQTQMQALMEQYQDVPMDLADASLVTAAEALNRKQIFTLDRDFYIYRLPGNQSFDVIP